MADVPPIKSMMTRWPHAVAPDAPLAEAQRFMRKMQIRHLPVLDAGTVVGIVTDRDIKLVLGPDFDYPPIRELTVRDVVAEAYVVDENEPATTVLAEMVRRHIGSAVVTESGHLAGIFTALDACRQLSALLRDRADDENGPH